MVANHIGKFVNTTDWDAIVVGAGAAGATSAYLLAKSGLSVLLLDKKKFPRDKVCGCCLSGRSVQTLSDIGLASVLDGAIACDTFVMGANHRQARLKTSGGMTISRSELDQRLVKQAIDMGVTFLQGETATIDAIQGDRRRVLIGNGRRHEIEQGKVVLACGGLGQRVTAEDQAEKIEAHSKIGFAAILPPTQLFEPHTIYMATGSVGYVGLVVLEDGRLNIASALNADVIRANSHPGLIIEELIESAGFPVPDGLKSVRWTGTPLLTRRRHQLAAERLFVLGDAAGYVEPFTGEGMAWAFAGSQAGLPLVLSAVKLWDNQLCHQWEQVYRKTVTRRQWSIRILKMILNHPRLVSTTLPVLQLLPSLASPIIHSIHGDSGNRSQTI